MQRRSGIKPNTSIRIDPDILHQARIGTVTTKQTLGQWLEEAIQEKREREKEADNVTETNSRETTTQPSYRSAMAGAGGSRTHRGHRRAPTNGFEVSWLDQLSPESSKGRESFSYW